MHLMHGLPSNACQPDGPDGLDRKSVDLLFVAGARPTQICKRLPESTNRLQVQVQEKAAFHPFPIALNAVTKRSPVRGTYSANFSVSKCCCLVPSFVLALCTSDVEFSFFGSFHVACGPSHGAE
jgi:hypothetical protein